MDRFEIGVAYDAVSGMDVSFGNDTITDFCEGDDLSLSAWSGATVSASYVGTDTVLTFWARTAQESTVTLHNYEVDPLDLPSDGIIPAGNWTLCCHGYAQMIDDMIVDAPGLSSWLYGEGGNDTLFGQDMGDWLFGGSGDDEIEGGGGADVIYGDFGEDTILGGDGDDIIYARLEMDDDLITGGAGQDRFHFEFNSDYLTGAEIAFGNDTVAGFADGDVLEFQSFLSAPVSLDLAISGTDTIVTFGVGTGYESTVTLQNYHMLTWDLASDQLSSFLAITG